MKSYIESIGTAVPETKISQSQVVAFMTEVLHLSAEENHRLTALYRSTGIQHRHTVLEDYSRKAEDYDFFPQHPDREPFPMISRRMELYRQYAASLAHAAIQDCTKSIDNFTFHQVTHLITVSCTGMYAPGIDIELVEILGLNTDVQRIAINFMGCYAAFTALRVADSLCKANPEARVLVVCVELCSLHFQKSRKEDHALSNAIFADGAAALLISGKKPPRLSLSLVSQYADLVLTGKPDMAWHIGDFGFEMVLSAYVPELIEKGIFQLTRRLLEKMPVQVEDIRHFAIHPGGKRILEVIEKQLGLTRHDNRFAYEILKNYGNMSSPTVLFVLKNLWQSLSPEDSGKPVLSFAFGPGLTLESALFEIETNATPK